MPASEAIQADKSPPSEIEVMREIGFLENHKGAGPEGLLPSFFKDGSEEFPSWYGLH